MKRSKFTDEQIAFALKQAELPHHLITTPLDNIDNIVNRGCA